MTSSGCSTANGRPSPACSAPTPMRGCVTQSRPQELLFGAGMSQAIFAGSVRGTGHVLGLVTNLYPMGFPGRFTASSGPPPGIRWDPNLAPTLLVDEAKEPKWLRQRSTKITSLAIRFLLILFADSGSFARHIPRTGGLSAE